MSIICINQEDKVNQPKIEISIKNDMITVVTVNYSYEDMLNALQGLTYATTKKGLDFHKGRMRVYEVMRDVTETVIDARDSVLEDTI